MLGTAGVVVNTRLPLQLSWSECTCAHLLTSCSSQQCHSDMEMNACGRNFEGLSRGLIFLWQLGNLWRLFTAQRCLFNFQFLPCTFYSLTCLWSTISTVQSSHWFVCNKVHKSTKRTTEQNRSAGSPQKSQFWHRRLCEFAASVTHWPVIAQGLPKQWMPS